MALQERIWMLDKAEASLLRSYFDNREQDKREQDKRELCIKRSDIGMKVLTMNRNE